MQHFLIDTFAYCIECVISLRLYFDVKLGGVVGLAERFFLK